MSFHSIEMMLLSAIWKMPEFKVDTVERGMFRETLDKFDRVIQYRKDGNPLGDISISQEILGFEFTKELAMASTEIVEVTIPHYIRQLSLSLYKKQLWDKLQEGQISEELLGKGLLLFKKTQEDETLYDMQGDLTKFVVDTEKRIKGEIPLYYTGFSQLDQNLGPLEPGNFCIIKALTKTGKTNFACSIFLKMIKKQINCLYITSEMGYIELIRKMVSMVSGVQATKIRTGKLTPEEMARIMDCQAKVLYNPYGKIKKTGIFNMEQVKDLVDETKAKVIFIDYLQMFGVGDDSSRVEQFEQIACQIKDIAMMKDVVIIGLSQVNEKGMGKWCSAWEEKCDQSISLKTTDDSDSAIKQFDVTVEFNRQGTNGLVKMVMRKTDCMIRELDKMEVPSDVVKQKEQW